MRRAAVSEAAGSFWSPPRNNKAFIELFSGAGGLSLGLHSAGWTSKFAIEKDPMAWDTYAANFLDQDSPFAGRVEWLDWVPAQPTDIEVFLKTPEFREKLRSLRNQVDLIAGGPPCQGFSVGGARRGVDDPRNGLPMRFVELVDLVRPKLVMLENVEGFDKPFLHQGFKVSEADVVKQKFSEIGYLTVKKLVRAVECGVPQTRRRIVLFGVDESVASGLTEEQLSMAFDFLFSKHAANLFKDWLPHEGDEVSAGSAIDDLSGSSTMPTPDSPKFQSVKYLPANSDFQRLMRAFSDSDTPDSHRLPKHTDRVLHLIRTAQRTQKPGRLPSAFLRESGTKSRKKFLVDKNRPISTLTSHPDEFFHHTQERILTLRETARLQSFPDAFVFRGRYTLNGDRRGLDVSRCVQVGNAIPPLMGAVLGQVANSLLDALLESDLTNILKSALEHFPATSEAHPTLF